MTCCTTGMNGAWSSAPVGVWPPQLLKNCENAASISSLFVTGAVYQNCMIFSELSRECVDSGDQLPKPPTAIQSSPRTRHWSASFTYEPPSHTFW